VGKPFLDRADAGRKLAARLSTYGGQPDVVVLGLPRGGVVVAYEVAKELHAPLDAFIVRKLGVPFQPELAMGAIATGDVCVVNKDVIQSLQISPSVIETVMREERKEMRRREKLYRGDSPSLEIKDRTVIVIDDGLATGSTMRVAIHAIREIGPRRVVMAVPVGALETFLHLKSEVDEAVCLLAPDPFFSISGWYENFGQTTDEEVKIFLDRAAPFC
jgi:putative phosphoribosyl transferase